MSGEFLSAGSTEPPKVAGKLRLYGLKLSPTTQQARLVLLVKNVPHDLVNVNPKSIPDWYKKIQPEGKFPALDTGDQLLVGTQAIVEYLDEKFPDPALFTAGSDKKAVLGDILQKLEPIAKEAKLLVENKDAKPSQEVQDLVVRLSEWLKTAGTLYIGGNSPGASDLMVWPWIQAGSIPMKLHGKNVVSEEMIEKLTPVRNWKKAMEKLKAVQDVIVPEEEYLNYLR